MKRAFGWLGVVGVVVIGCGADRPLPTGPTGICGARSGSYRFTFVEQSGNCGTTPDETIAAGNFSASLPATCTNNGSISADSCSETVDSVCPGATGYRVVRLGDLYWLVDGSSGSGTMQVRIEDISTGRVSCASGYNVTMTRL